MKRLLCIIISFAIILALSGFTYNTAMPSDSTLLSISTPLINAYKEFYDVRNARIIDKELNSTEDGYYVDYFIELDLSLKYDSAVELPHVRGLAASLDINVENMTTSQLINSIVSTSSKTVIADSSNKLVSSISNKVSTDVISKLKLTNNGNINAVNALISDTEKATSISEIIVDYTVLDLKDFLNELENEYIGVETTLSLGIRSYFDSNGNNTDNKYLLLEHYVDDMSAITPKSETEMYREGIQHLDDTINAVVNSLLAFTPSNELNSNAATTAQSFTYYRVSARDYANTYTSNASSHYCSTHQGYIRMDTSVYNSGYTWYCCNDCANYVSQAMHKGGGVPCTTTWAGPSSSAWKSCTSMRNYFTSQGWWVTSNSSSCNAGGIILLSDSSGPYHAMMCVLNNTVSKAYSAHTNDRLQIGYSSFDSGTEYYVFSKMYPAT